VVSLQGGYSLLYEQYIDQNIVGSEDQILGGGRVDYLQTWSGAVGYPRPVRLFDTDCRLDSKMNLSFSYNGSNQNYFDANTTQYFSDAYSYLSYGLGPTFNLAWGDKKRPVTVSASFNYTHLTYLNRQAEDSSGVYTGDRLQQDSYTMGLGGSYPIGPGFYFKVQTNLLWARSNNTDETEYAYNYRTANYLMGFTYEF
jgi:hypothetical protein